MLTEDGSGTVVTLRVTTFAPGMGGPDVVYLPESGLARRMEQHLTKTGGNRPSADTLELGEREWVERVEWVENPSPDLTSAEIHALLTHARRLHPDQAAAALNSARDKLERELARRLGKD